MIPCQLHLDCFEPCPHVARVCQWVRDRGPGISKFTPGIENDTVPSQYFASRRNKTPAHKRKFKRLNFGRGKEETDEIRPT